ncbi:MAG: adenylyl-sulfate kinase, partial [Pseudanabaena sp.]
MSLPPIIEQMLSPEFYDHPVTKPIQLLQTHISFILLTGSYAYKVKKPMNFGFLDFSTLEKRKYFCEEELRLNRRLAPELYLSVLSIVETDGKYRFDQTGTGLPVEYAILMPEFPQDDLLIEMFASGRLTADHVKQIGEQLAAFHQQAATNDYINTFGT